MVARCFFSHNKQDVVGYLKVTRDLVNVKVIAFQALPRESICTQFILPLSPIKVYIYCWDNPNKCRFVDKRRKRIGLIMRSISGILSPCLTISCIPDKTIATTRRSIAVYGHGGIHLLVSHHRWWWWSIGWLCSSCKYSKSTLQYYYYYWQRSVKCGSQIESIAAFLSVWYHFNESTLA